MTEPFMPRHHHDDPIDAADPGSMEARSDVNDADLDEQVEAFENRLDADRDRKSLFHTPKPDND